MDISGGALARIAARRAGILIFVNAFDSYSPSSSTSSNSPSSLSLSWTRGEHLGIDLIWFGVILGVNMQTSSSPTIGFALFDLRSFAPRKSYIDHVSGKRTDGVTTGQIYWARFVRGDQVIMVLLVILFPAMVMHYKGPHRPSIRTK